MVHLDKRLSHRTWHYGGVKLLKHISTLVIVVLLAALAVPALPAAAQDGTPNVNINLPVCTAEQDAQLAALMKDFIGNYKASEENLADATLVYEFITLTLKYDGAATYLQNNDLADLPECLDATILVGDAQLMLANAQLIMLSKAMVALAQEANDTEQVDAWQGAVDFFSDNLSYYSSDFDEGLKTIASGPYMTKELPTCTEEDRNTDAMIQIEDLKTVFNDAMPDFQAFLEDGAWNPNLFGTILGDVLMSWEPTTADTPYCAEINFELAMQGALYYDTVLALSYANLSEFAAGQDEPDMVTAQQLSDVETSVIDRLKLEVTLVFPES